MATDGDFRYLEYVIGLSLVEGPVLEIGALDWQQGKGNMREITERAGLSWTGADIQSGPSVDYVFDLLDRASVEAITRRWRTVLLFNILEHVYDPLRALENAVHLIEPGGVCVIAGPTVWQLHDYPRDYWRPLPDTYVEFATRNGMELVDDGFRWIVGSTLLPVSSVRNGDQKLLPSTEIGDSLWGRFRWAYSRVAHRALNTAGRQLFFPYSALGVVLRRPD